jgi:hypothetical protein
MQYSEIRAPGLHMMGHICDPDRLVADMCAMGIECSQSGKQLLEVSSKGGA